MKKLINMMKSDHHIIAHLVAKLNDQGENKKVILQDLKKIIQRHFTWEQEVLFPEFEQNVGVMGKEIVFTLKAEHQQIQDLFIQNIGKQLNSVTIPDPANTLFGLIDLLKMHKKLEEEIFYSWFDKNLTDHEMHRLIEKMKNKSKTEINHQ